METTDKDLPKREQVTPGEVRGNMVYPKATGKQSQTPIGIIGEDRRTVYPYITGPTPKNQVPIGDIKGGKYYPRTYSSDSTK